MTAIAWSDVVGLDSGLSTVSAIWQTIVLGYVNTILAVEEFDGEDGEHTKISRCLLAAHFASLFAIAANGAAGPIASESGGGLSVSFATAMTPKGLGATLWGQTYEATTNTVARGPFIF